LCFFCDLGGKETRGTQGQGEKTRGTRKETRGEEGRNCGKTSGREKTRRGEERSDSSTATASAGDCAQSVHALRGLRSQGSSLPQRIPRWVPLFSHNTHFDSWHHI